MLKTFLIRVVENQTESVYKMDTNDKALDFVAKVITREHPGSILSIHQADTAAGTIAEYEAVLNGYQLELREKMA